MRILPYYFSNRIFKILLVYVFIFTALLACGSDSREYVDVPYDKENLPSMATDSVTELISDSGIIRYKLITDTWLFFENAADPHWYFPDGLYLEQFDTTFQIQATLKSDTAWNYTQRKLWKLKGNVFVRNARDETFESEELFWDERSGRVYSDKYIEINRPEKLMLKGRGFESNQEMTEYRIFHPFDTDLFFEDDSPQPARQRTTIGRDSLPRQDSIRIMQQRSVQAVSTIEE